MFALTPRIPGPPYVLALAVLACTACGAGAPKPDDEAALNTYGCDLAGERVVVRFDIGEARLLMPGGERVNLYQVPTGAGLRYTNGSMDLIGRVPELSLARDGGAPVPMTSCSRLTPPKK